MQQSLTTEATTDQANTDQLSVSDQVDVGRFEAPASDQSQEPFKPVAKEAEWFARHLIDEAYRRYGDQVTDPNRFLCENLLFVTATFKPHSVSIRGGYKPHPMDEFSEFYLRVVKSIYGTNFKRKRRHQPYGHGFIDFEGSRYARMINPGWGENPHVHAMVFCSPQVRLKFQLRLGDQYSRKFIRSDLNSIDSIVVRQFDPSKSSVPELMEYCMKAYLKTPEHWRSDPAYKLWEVFPR
jgi:hypothetical protein